MKTKTQDLGRAILTYAEVEINGHVVKLMVEDKEEKSPAYMGELARWTRKLEDDLRANRV